MGILLGACLGLGLVLLLLPRGERRPRVDRGAQRLAQAGLDGVSTAQLRLAAAAGALVAGAATAVVSGVPALGAVAALAAARAPGALVAQRARTRQAELRELWPDVVDDLTSAVRAGRSLPEALAGLGERGPEQLRPAFAAFGEDHRATGSFAVSLDRLAARLRDPVADQVLATLRLAREVGGADLGTVLRTLSGFVRDEARSRAELEVRRSWTVNAARLALAAPWAVLALLALGSPATVDAYNRPAGLVVLAIGAGVSAAAYRLMIAIGTLPEPPRVLTGPG